MAKENYLGKIGKKALKYTVGTAVAAALAIVPVSDARAWWGSKISFKKVSTENKGESPLNNPEKYNFFVAHKDESERKSTIAIADLKKDGIRAYMGGMIQVDAGYFIGLEKALGGEKISFDYLVSAKGGFAEGVNKGDPLALMAEAGVVPKNSKGDLTDRINVDSKSRMTERDRALDERIGRKVITLSNGKWFGYDVEWKSYAEVGGDGNGGQGTQAGPSGNKSSGPSGGSGDRDGA